MRRILCGLLFSALFTVFVYASSALKLQSYPIPSLPFRAIVTDFDGNGWPDIAVVSKFSDATVFMNLSQGKPVQPLTLRGHTQPVSLTTGDFNGDGRPDVVLMTESLIGPLYINDGRGGFSRANLKLKAPPMSFFIEAADFNNDGLDDLVATGKGGTGPVVYINKGNLTFSEIPVPLRKDLIPKSNQKSNMSAEPPFASHKLTVYDIDGDGKKDVLVPDEQRGCFWLLHNMGQMVFKPEELYCEKGRIAKDVAVIKYRGGTVIVLLFDKSPGESEFIFLRPNPDRGYSATERYTMPSIEQIRLDDMDRDGVPEIVALINRGGKLFLSIYKIASINSGPVFKSPGVVKSSFSITTGDIDRDGLNDIIIPDYGDNALKIIFSPLKSK